MKKERLKNARQGDINAFQELFAPFQDSLKSYLYRLLASRSDADDLCHDTFIRAYDKLDQFAEKSSFKTWVFQIATRLAYNYLNKRKRWLPDVNEKAKELVGENPGLVGEIQGIAQSSAYGSYEIKEHIDTCFTCMGKTLLPEHQVALILKDVYGFSMAEIEAIMEKSEGSVKHLVQESRKTLTDIFERRCALVSKKGSCHQCSELNGWFNPRQNAQEEKMKLKMVKQVGKKNHRELYELRTLLVQGIDPLKSPGNELQEVLMKCNRMVMGEVS